MIRMKQNGVKKLFLVSIIIIFNSSCGGVKSYQRYNILTRDLMINYYNSKIDFRLKFYGDYKFYKSVNKRTDHFKNSEFYKERLALLFVSRTHISPYHNCIGYVVSPKASQVYLGKGFKYISDNVWVSEMKSTGQTVSIDYLVKIKNYDVVISAWSDYEINLPDTQKKQDLDTLLRNEIRSIAQSSSNHKISQNSFEIAEKSFNNSKLGDYLAAIRTLLTNPVDESDVAAYNFHYQALATYYSFIGDVQSVDTSLAKIGDKLPYKKSTNKILSDFIIHEGIDSLFSLVKNERVIMINESHFRSEHRYLVSQMLPKLKKLGFTYLAIEALNESDKKLARRGFPIQSSGYYTRDINMANLIRLGISLGFKIVSYDTTKEARESYQANTLYDKTLKNDADGKLIVLAGHSHINESRLKDNKKWMASHFRSYSSIDPLTINQEKFHNQEVIDGQLYTLDPIKKGNCNNDLYIINGYKGYISKFSDSTYFRVPILVDSINTAGKSNLLRLYLKNEFDKVNNPTPVLIYSGELPKFVDLPNGSYIIRFEIEKYVHLFSLIIRDGKSSISEFSGSKKKLRF